MSTDTTLTRETLPEWLRARAERHGAAAALRDKRRGLWHSETWKQLEASVAALAAGLSARGFLPGDRLLIEADPSPAVFRLALAAQWAGGAVVTRDPGTDAHDAEGPRFAFVADDAARILLRATLAGQALSLGIVRDGDDLPEAPGPWLSLEELARIGGAAAPLAPVATTASVALIRPRSEAITPSGGGASAADGARERLTHADIVADARRLLAAGGIGAGKEALAARDVPNAAQLGSVLGAWLVAGLTLSFVETAETEDQDRRELGPHVVFGRAGGYTDLAARTNEALPQGRGLWTRWLSSALDGSGAASLARRLLVSRLREVVGFGRLERAIVLDDAAAARAGLQRLFGVAPFEWPSRAGSRLAPAPPALEALPESSLLGGLGAASRSDLA